MLKVCNLVCGYGSKIVLQDISFQLEAGEVLCLLGPNGSGKTTLFKTMLGLQNALQGSISCNDEELISWSRQKRARTIGYIPQNNAMSFPFSVLEVVIMGRTAHIGLFSVPKKRDKEAAQEALLRLKIEHLAEKDFNKLSGGERQLVLAARALAQEPALLLMDEPTASLDFSNQYLLLDKVCRLAAEDGLAVMMSSHQPSQAFMHASKVMLLNKKGGMQLGTPKKILTEENLQAVYGIKVRVISGGGGKEPGWQVCLPLPGQECY